MQSDPFQATRKKSYHVMWFQLVAVVILSVIGCFSWGWRGGYSVLLGGGIVIAPNLLFAYRVFVHRRKRRTPTQILGVLFGWEVVKLALIAILFVLVMKYLPVQILHLFVGFIGAIVAFWIAPIWVYRKKFRK